MIITSPSVAEYAEQHTSEPDQMLYNLERWTHLNMAQPRMIAGAYQGRLLTMLCQMISPSLVLEIGSYVGYSTICLARGLAAEGKVHAVEVDVECEPKILRHLDQAGVSDKVVLHIGDALELVPRMDVAFDLVFVDAGKAYTRECYELALSKLRMGGWLLVDNVLWDGKVADSNHHDNDTERFRQFNDFVQQDARVENILLPLRDGLMLCRKVAE